MAIDALNNTNPVNTAPPKTVDKSTTTSGASTDVKEATLNYDSFLKLLVAQMKNQDPTDPIDASEQMSQLATFSGVEQAIKTNKHLESLIQENSLTQATGLIGKTITSADGEITGVVKSVEINSDGLTATLENGKEIVVGTGITVASSNTTPPVVDAPDDGGTQPDGETDPTNSSGE